MQQSCVSMTWRAVSTRPYHLGRSCAAVVTVATSASQKGHREQALEPRSEHDLPSG